MSAVVFPADSACGEVYATMESGNTQLDIQSLGLVKFGKDRHHVLAFGGQDDAAYAIACSGLTPVQLAYNVGDFECTSTKEVLGQGQTLYVHWMPHRWVRRERCHGCSGGARCRWRCCNCRGWRVLQQ